MSRQHQVSSVPRTHYDVLEVSRESSNLEIKKAYRRLALLHHPDRNNGSPESTEKFQQVGEAFQCLSDPGRRRDYDASLREAEHQLPSANGTPFSPRNAAAATGGSPFASQSTSSPFQHSHFAPKDPFEMGDPFDPFGRRQTAHRQNNAGFDARAQFDYLFRQDPFFREAFKDMDEEFARRFRHQDGRGGSFDVDANHRAVPATNTAQPPPANGNNNAATTRTSRSTEGWIPWLLRQCGVEFHMTTYTSDSRGGISRTSYSSDGRSAYSQRTSERFRDRHGRWVTVQRIEQNGNQIEDQLVNDRLVQRKINGVVEPLERIAER
jgi:curved DNA-binding protein CbpA